MDKMRNIMVGGLMLMLAVAPAFGSSFRPVLEQERAFVGATHVATISYSDLTETNVNTAQTLTGVMNVAAKQRVELIGMELVTAFNAGNNATGSVCVTVGDGAAGADFYLDSTELDSNLTEVYSKFGRGYQGVTTTTIAYGKTNDPTVTVTAQRVTLNYAGTNNPTVTVTGVLVTNSIVYLDASSNICTNTIVYLSAVPTATATLTAATVDLATNATATATLTKGSQSVVTALTGDAAGRKVYTADDTIDFVFTPNSVNSLSQNTAGEVKFYFKVIR